MYEQKNFRRLSVAAWSMSALVPNAWAQQDAPKPPETPSKSDDPVQLDTVKVTGERIDEGFKASEQSGATKSPLTLRETPQSVSVITREGLDDRQVINLQQALELSAGVRQFSGNGPFAGQPSFGFNQTTIRGIGIDDLYDFRDDGFVSGSYFQVPDLAIYDRIEVIKGPNSVLYGRGSVGGLINRVRKKPLAEARADLELSAGSFDTYRADVDVTGPLLSSKTVRGRVVGVYEDSGSFVDGVETQRTVLAPSLSVDLSPSTNLLVQALYQSEDIIPNTGMPLAPVGNGYEAPKIPRSQYNGVITRKPYTWETQSIAALLEQKLGDGWLATLRLASSSIDTPIRVDSYTYGFAAGDDPETEAVERRGDTSLVRNDFAIDRDVWSGELLVSGSFDLAGRRTKLSFGVDHTESEYARRGAYDYFTGTANIYDGNFVVPDGELIPGSSFGGDPRSTGYYAQAQIAATDRLKVLLGARYDEVDLRSFSGDTIDRENVSDTTGRIGLTYDLSEQVSVYTLYAQSFTPVSSTDINGQLLDPETGEVYEIGTKTDWYDGRLGVSAALYLVDREDIPVNVREAIPNPEDPEGTPVFKEYSISTGLQRAQGFEVEVNGRPLPGWDLSLAYNNVESKFKNLAPDDPFIGKQPGGTADWQLGLYSAYEVQTGPLKGFGFGATLFAIADRGLSTFVVGTIPGYERVDLHAFYKGFKNVEINLVVRNVTDERYIEGADRASNYATFGSPTAALLSVRYSLGKD